MNPEMESIWKQLPNDLFLENVLCFLDVDTRRCGPQGKWFEGAKKSPVDELLESFDI